MKPNADNHRGPYLSQRYPTNGPKQVGNTNGRKIRPAPVESQPNKSLTKMGSVLSKADRRTASAIVPQNAASNLGLVNNPSVSLAPKYPGHFFLLSRLSC